MHVRRSDGCGLATAAAETGREAMSLTIKLRYAYVVHQGAQALITGGLLEREGPHGLWVNGALALGGELLLGDEPCGGRAGDVYSPLPPGPQYRGLIWVAQNEWPVGKAGRRAGQRAEGHGA